MFAKRIARETSFDIHEPTSLNGPLNYSPKTITAILTRARRDRELDHVRGYGERKTPRGQ